ncbi:MAG: EAL domain-containing protein [Gammaproteobacteria bacterium]|nr:EAL domain-containing protein [Gammaproteobacteria bacterium]
MHATTTLTGNVNQPSISWRVWVAPVFLALFLIFISQQNFLLFHTLAELFAIAVAIILSVVAWHTYSFSRNHFLMYIGAGYFWIGILDLVHALAFKGMEVIPIASANVSTQFWIISRFCEATLLLSSAWFFFRKINRVAVFVFFGLGTVISYIGVIEGYFPVTYIDGVGLTPFKVYSEYIIIALLLLAVIVISKNKNMLDRHIYTLMIWSILFTASAELIFTLYIDVYSFKMIAGHLLKFFSYWFIFIAVVRTTLTEPYQIMARGSSTYDAIPTPTIVVDQNGIIYQVNKAACKSVGMLQHQIIGKHCHDYFHPLKTKIEDCPVCRNIYASQPLDSIEVNFPESERWREFTLEPFEIMGNVKGMVHVSSDITVRKASQEALIYQASYDQLTQLPSRTLALDRIEVSIRRATRKKTHAAVIFADLDNFKNINDTLGHIFGDELLVKVARRLGNNVRDSDTLSRWGGDEFIIILPDLDDVQNAEHIAEKIIEDMSRPFVINEREFIVSISLGIAGFPDDANDVTGLLSHADAAMYHAKNAGKNTYRFFTPEMNDKAEHDMKLESNLRNAIRNNELSLHYQPQIDLSSNKITGCEALLRWNNKALGQVAPDIFIPVAEDTGLIISIGDWVLQQACNDMTEWQAQGYDDFQVSVNVSSRQLRSECFIDDIKNIINNAKFKSGSLKLELTESILLNGEMDNIELLQQINQLGISLSLDDFGTGYSSLSYLKKFPFDEIKIDRSFVSDIPDNTDDAILCEAIIAMAKSLKLTIVGEGVETEEQLEFLKKHGADAVQGFYFSKAIPADEFIAFVKNFN